MKKYICDSCGRDLELCDDEIHITISYGRNAITSEGKYGDGYTATLCKECAPRMHKWIGDHPPHKFIPGAIPVETMAAKDFVKAFCAYCEEWSTSRTKRAESNRVSLFLGFLRKGTYTWDGKELHCPAWNKKEKTDE